jgi:hypothetical protein
MTEIETMQREGREYWGVHVAPGHGQHHQEKILDQHTANVWMAAQESMKKEIALDLRESFMENDGEDSYIQLSARIVLFIRKLEKQHD